MRVTLSLIARTAPVAPACRVTPKEIRKIPGMNRRLDPSIRIPSRPRRYGGVHTVTLKALPPSWSRFGRAVTACVFPDQPCRDGDVADHHHPDDDAEENREPRTAGTRHDGRCERRRGRIAAPEPGSASNAACSRHGRPDPTCPDSEMAKANTALRKKLATVSAVIMSAIGSGSGHATRERFAMERMGLEVEHRQPDPHRREDLDKVSRQLDRRN